MMTAPAAVRTFVSLGSNLGDRARHLRGAVSALQDIGGVRVIAASPVYENPAHTLEPDQVQPPFLNAVVEIETTLGPEELLKLLQQIEREAGRLQAPQWEPRPLDVDLLLYGGVQRGPEEVAPHLPHPRLTERGFVLRPLVDLDPEITVPGTGKTVEKLLEQCGDSSPLEPTTLSLISTAAELPDELRYVAVEGVIGAGKTSLARMLAERVAGRLVLEEFEENPFLPDFYRNPDRWAFHTQLAFLASRFRQQKPLLTRDLFHQRTISDYTFDKDRIFAHITLEGDELQLYESVYTLMEPSTAVPDLVVYLHSSVDRLMHNITRRGRSYERNMQRSYIEEVSGAYDRYFKHYNKGPLLIVDSTGIDFVNRPDDFERLMTRIAAMAGRPGTSVFNPPPSLELDF
jgi:deoxyguanosine kinase